MAKLTRRSLLRNSFVAPRTLSSGRLPADGRAEVPFGPAENTCRCSFRGSRAPSATGDQRRRFAPDLKPEQYSTLIDSARRRWLPRIVRNGDGKDRNEPTRGSSRAHTA